VLTKGVAWDVLEYAQRNATFPNDGTDKQWFRSNTFAAYQQLGHDVASAMLAVAEKPLPAKISEPPKAGWTLKVEFAKGSPGLGETSAPPAPQ